MGNLISNVIHTTTRPNGARLNILMFDSPTSQIISFGYTKHLFYIFNTHEDKKWNTKNVLLPDNFTLVSDDSVTASPLIDVNYDLIIYNNPLLEHVVIEYSKKLHIPVLKIENNHKKNAPKNLYCDVVVYTNQNIKESWGGKDTDYLCDSILKEQNEIEIKDFSEKWNEILTSAASIKSGVYYENS